MAEDTLGPTVAAARAGDSAAIARLLSDHLPPLETFVRLKAGHNVLAHESVHDVVQTVCREALQQLGSFEYRGDQQFRHWLFRLATHKIVDRAKFWNRECRDPARHDEIDTELGHAGATPSRIASAREELARFERIVAELPDDQREAVAYVKVLGLPYGDVAGRMKRSESAVRGLVARGLAQIADRIE